MHHTPLIATIVAGLTVAFAFGALAHRLKLSPLVGYLLAGVVVGPFTPGYVADQALATELAELGVILLMFGVGLHFSVKDLLSVKSIAIPGALVQIAVATLLGLALGLYLGWTAAAGFVFGLALSVASTVVLLRAMQERRLVQTDRGRIAVGWLIVEDLAMVLALVLLPAMAEVLGANGGGQASFSSWAVPLGITLAKVTAFAACMLLVARRVIPAILHWTAHTGSRELFRLAVLAIALGVAFGAAALFDVSFALGAFFAGMILAESELSQRAAEETLPLRDAFAVLFFVSVGMLFNPLVLIEQPWPLLATVAIIIFGKSIAAFGIVKAFGYENKTAVTVSASLAQIGEFSFILATLGVSMGLLPSAGRDLILAGAILSIVINPFLFTFLVDPERVRAKKPAETLPKPANDLLPTNLSEHVIVVGFGRVGRIVAERLEAAEYPFLVIDLDEASQRRASDAGFEVLLGNAAEARVLSAAGIALARRLIIAIPNGFEAGGVVQEARLKNPDLEIIARAHSDAEVEHLSKLGATQIILSERELAEAMVKNLKRAPASVAPVAPLAEPRASTGDEERPLLSDAEWALAAEIRALGLGPEQTASQAKLIGGALALGGFKQDQLEEALQGLVDKTCVTLLGDDLFRVTPLGLRVSLKAPTHGL